MFRALWLMNKDPTPPTEHSLYPPEPVGNLYKDTYRKGEVFKLKKSINKFERPWRNEASSMDLPPHMKVILYDDDNYAGDQFTYRGHQNEKNSIPGYVPILKNTSIGDNNNNSVKVITKTKWKDHIFDCCTNSAARKNLCSGRWFGGNSWWGSGNSPPCDDYIKKMCKMPDNEHTKFCSCFNSNIEHPACFDKRCIDGGYKTTAMKNKGCNITTINCNQIINAETQGKVILDKAKMNQHCGNIDKGSSPLTIPSTPAWQPNTVPIDQTQKSMSSKKKKQIVFIVIIFFILILLIVGIDVAISGGNNSQLYDFYIRHI